MTLQAYHELIERKRVAFVPRGFDDIDEADLPPRLFEGAVA